MIKSSIFFGLLLLFNSSFASAGSNEQGFDKSAYYAAMSADNLEQINTQLAILKGISFPEKEAYEGALLMKKSGLVTNTKEKLNLFKSGRTKLESSISKDKVNTEYHFLRLIIQEHAPKIVKYRDDIDEDCQLIHSNFKILPQFLQQAITDYSKKSKALKNP